MNKEEYLSRLYFLQNMKPYELLQELLAIIHGDNGAMVAEVGPARAVLNAEVLWRASCSALELQGGPATPNLVSGD